MYQSKMQYRGFHYLNCSFDIFLKVKCMQRPGTEAIKTQIQPSKPKREITKITNIQNTKGTYNGQLSEQLFSKRWLLRHPNQTLNKINTHKMKRHKNSDTENRQQRP